VIVRPGKFPQPNQQNQMEAVFQQFKLEVGVPFPLRLRGLLVATGLLCLHLVRAAALSGALTASPHTSSAMEALCHSIVIEL